LPASAGQLSSRPLGSAALSRRGLTVKDITSTSFGLVIADFLPGLVALLGLAYWIPPLKAIFTVFSTAESNVGLFLLVALAAIAVSLVIGILRWAVFEPACDALFRLPSPDFASLGAHADKLSAFRAAVDEHYRYHQCFGGFALALPILYFGWIADPTVVPGLAGTILFWVVFALLEGALAAGAVDAYCKYSRRRSEILGGGS